MGLRMNSAPSDGGLLSRVAETSAQRARDVIGDGTRPGFAERNPGPPVRYCTS
jgi:hypothetical protein